MKKIINFIAILLVAVPLASTAQMGKAYDMMIDGVKVIVQPSGNEIVSIQVALKGGVQNYAAGKAGIEALAMTALTECGTAKQDKNSFKDQLDKYSAQVYGSTNMDYANMSLNCIKSDFDNVWPLYTEAMLTPAFNAKEFTRIKDDAVNNIRANEGDPDNALNKMARQTAFAGKNYAKDPEGTVETVGKLTVEETKKYWQSIFTRSRMVIVIVGDLDRSVVEAKVKAFLDQVPKGVPVVIKKEVYTPAANSFKAQPRENATNYIQGITGGPQPGTPDFNAFLLAMRIFSSKHFVEVRTKNGLSYAPQSWFNQGNANFANISVTTTDPDKYIAVARQLIDRIKKDGFTPDELKNIKTQYLTAVYSRQETNDAQAGSLIFNEVIHNNWKRANSINEDVKKVTLDQLNSAFSRYINNITWSYQGDPKKVTPGLFTQKETPAVPTEKKAF
jgi:zinc protease